MSNNVKSAKPIYIRLKEYIDTHDVTNKDLAKLFGYAEPNISEFLQGKSKDASKLHTIAKLFLELEELKENKYSEADIDKLEEQIIALQVENGFLKGELTSFKEQFDHLKNLTKLALNKN